MRMMPLRALPLLLTAVGLTAAAADAGRYSLEPHPDARLELFVAKTGLMSGKRHHFVFPRYAGTLELNAGQLTRSSVSLVMEAAALECRDTWVSDSDLKKIRAFALNEMLASAQHPQILFQSSSIESAGEGGFLVKGELRLRGVGKPAAAKVMMRQTEAGPRFEGAAIVRMKDWNLKPPTAALGMIGTKDEMEFHFILIGRPITP